MNQEESSSNGTAGADDCDRPDEIANSEHDEVALLNETAPADETASVDETAPADETAPVDETAATPLDHTAPSDHANGICDGHDTAAANDDNAAAITPFATINQANKEVQNPEVPLDGGPNNLDNSGDSDGSDSDTAAAAADSSRRLNGVVSKLAPHSTAGVDSREHPDGTADGNELTLALDDSFDN